MGLDPALLESFLEHLSEPHSVQARASGRVEERLSEILETARGQWPTLRVDPQQFLAYLASRLSEAPEIEPALERLHASDLYLAQACAGGDSPAIAAFETHCLSCIDQVAVQLKLSNATTEEVKQTLRVQLFVAPAEDAAPMITNYSGRGSLRNWVRIIAVRTAGKLMDRGKREVLLTESVMDGMLPASDNLELDFLKRTYRDQFRTAFQNALQSLSSRERNLLGHHFVDRLNIDEIGTLYSVHRATAARWLVRARESLLKRTRQALMQQIQVNRAEYDSIIRLIESQLPVSFPDLPADEELDE